MSTGLIGYHPARVADLQRAVRHAVDHLLRAPAAADASAAPAESQARLVRAHLESDWLPLLVRIAGSTAMTTFGVSDAGPPMPVAARVAELTANERAYLQGHVDAVASGVARNLWLQEAHPDYQVANLDRDLATLDSPNEWDLLARMYLIEQYHAMVAAGELELIRDGDAYWVDPVDLLDTRREIMSEIVLAAVVLPGNIRPGGAISRATAAAGTDGMPAPRAFGESDAAGVRPAGAPDAVAGYTRHGLERVMSRDGVGVSARAVLEAVRSPRQLVDQADGTFRYTGQSAIVVLNQHGLVVTVWATSKDGWRIR